MKILVASDFIIPDVLEKRIPKDLSSYASRPLTQIPDPG